MMPNIEKNTAQISSLFPLWVKNTILFAIFLLTLINALNQKQGYLCYITK